MAKIAWTSEALNCLRGIHEYIANDNPRAAVEVVSSIVAKVELIREHPRLGQRYEPIADREIRETAYGHYRIAYLLAAEDHIVVLGVFHGSMDIKSHLR